VRGAKGKTNSKREQPKRKGLEEWGLISAVLKKLPTSDQPRSGKAGRAYKKED